MEPEETKKNTKTPTPEMVVEPTVNVGFEEVETVARPFKRR